MEFVLDAYVTLVLVIVIIVMGVNKIIYPSWCTDRYKKHDFIPPVRRLHGVVVAGCVEVVPVYLLTTSVQSFSKLLCLLKVDALRGVASKGLNIHCHLPVRLVNLHARVSWGGRVGLVFSTEIEAHSFGHLAFRFSIKSILQDNLGQDRDGHFHLLLLLILAGYIPGGHKIRRSMERAARAPE